MSGDSDTTNLLDTHLETPLMSAATHDPFYVVKDELAGKLESIGKRLERFESLLWHTNTANNPDFRDAKKGLSREVKAAEAQLKDLELTVDYVERDRSAFAHIDDRELEDRQGFVASARQRVMAARETVSGAKTREKVDADEKEHLAQTRGNYGAQSDIEMQNTDYVHQSHAETRTIMQEQDEGLEQLDGAVDRVHRMAQEIHGELKTQGNLLEDLENEIDETSEKMNFVMGKLAKLLKTKDNCQLWTIIILTVLFLVMVLVLIWS
mmetsp:Transcript_6850/g.21237  ORF Transcript_6850/g.21237 Transcript_6850/m.21237 type:complete len:266 (-) Transcript_6850:291-1088(-)